MDDNRIHPRIKVTLPCEVRHDCGYCLALTAINLSLSGLTVKTTEADVKTIMTHHQPVNLNRPVEAKIKLELPDGDQQQSIRTTCRAIYVRRISQKEYRIGFKFLSISRADEEKIDHYVLAHLAD